MPDFPISFAPGYTGDYSAVGACTANASNNVKGAYAQLIAATAFDYDSFLIAVNVAANNVGELFDLAVGAAGSEQVIVPNILFAGLDRMATYFLAPIPIPAGSRIAARIQATNAGGGTTTGQITVIGMNGSMWGRPPGGRIIDIGINTATSQGTSLDPGPTPNTGVYGVWVQLVASVAADISALHFQFGNKQNITPQDLNLTTNSRLQIGVGAAASEQVIIDGIPFTTSDTSSYGPLPTVWFPCSIPAGSRIAARLRMSASDATDRVLELATHGLIT